MDKAGAVKSIETFHDQVFQGRRVIVNFAKTRTAPITSSRAPNKPGKTLFIGNLSYDMTDRDLNNLFSNIQNVIDVRVAVDRRSGQPRGFAHADFRDVESCIKAKESLQDKEVCGRVLRLDFGVDNKIRPLPNEE